MYSLSNIQNREYIPPNPVVDKRKIALSEFLYPAWVNMFEELGSNKIMNDRLKIKIPSNYYNISVLNDVLALYNLKIHADPVTGKLHVFCVVLSLFRAHNLMLYGTHVVDGVINRNTTLQFVHKELFVDLDKGLSTTKNWHSQPPSPFLYPPPAAGSSCYNRMLYTLHSLRNSCMGLCPKLRFLLMTKTHAETSSDYLNYVLKVI